MMRITKKKNINSNFLYLLLLFIIPYSSFSQEWGGEKPKNFWDHWSVNVNAGMTSYFGDLSYYDTDIVGKLSNESGFAGGFLITKHFSKMFGLSGQLLFGNLKGGDNHHSSFNTKIVEYNLQLRLDFIKLIMPYQNPKFGFEGFAGIGQMWFQSEQFKFMEGIPIAESHSSQVPELVYFAGAGMHYHIVEGIAITASVSLRQLQNDKLDMLVKNDNNDYYSYLSVGITYYIESKRFRPLKNKARVAHSGKRSR